MLCQEFVMLRVVLGVSWTKLTTASAEQLAQVNIHIDPWREIFPSWWTNVLATQFLTCMTQEAMSVSGALKGIP